MLNLATHRFLKTLSLSLSSLMLYSCLNSQNSFSNDNPNLAGTDVFSNVQGILTSPAHNCMECHAGEFPTSEEAFFDPNNGFISEDRIAENSELYIRISTNSSSDVMPPPGRGTALSEEEKNYIKKWIQKGPQKITH